ncbi:MAG: polysaccharide biosynthesis/export family protein [Saprospirales bacterium]|nr:polysaccharide biosynthesis/export family protein [Saprospirales bacterium]
MVFKYPTYLFLLLLAHFLLSSCGGVKYAQILMLDDVLDGSDSIPNLPVLSVRTDDIINIQVASRNPETVIAFQQQKVGGAGADASAGAGALGIPDGYRVDEEGNIYLPYIGKVHAAGKTIIKLREEITTNLIQFIPDVSVQIRFMNFRVTLLGEVAKPNTYIIPNERLTILEAIGMAGDFTPYAERNSVLFIRDRNNVREYARVNTQDKTLFLSEYFYLSPNDIIYVEPLKAKQFATQGDFVQRYSVIIVPFVSFLTFLLSALITK